MAPRKRSISAELGVLERRVRELEERRRDLVEQHYLAKRQVQQFAAARRQTLADAALAGGEIDTATIDSRSAAAQQRVKDTAEQVAVLAAAVGTAQSEVTRFRGENRAEFIEESKAVSLVEAETVAKLCKIAGEVALVHSAVRSTWRRTWGAKYREDAENANNPSRLSHFPNSLPHEKVVIEGMHLDAFEVLATLAEHFAGHTGLPAALLTQDRGQGLPGIYLDVQSGRETTVTRLMLYGGVPGDGGAALRADPVYRAAVTPDEDGCCRYHFVREIDGQPNTDQTVTPYERPPSAPDPRLSGKDFGIRKYDPADVAKAGK